MLVSSDTYQRDSMFRAVGIRCAADNFSSINKSALQVVVYRNNQSPCRWRGVTCDSRGSVRNVTCRWEDNMHLELLYLEWLPSTIEKIEIRSQHWAEKSTFSTRHLPKEAINVCISRCGLKGTLEMDRLPLKLEILDLRNNELRGTVILRHNPLDCVAVDNSSLSEKFENAYFRHKSSRKSIRCIEISGESIDPRIAFETEK